MVVIPRKKAIFENLNSYYVDIPKLIEHFQGEIGSGSIYFKSNTLEGVFFFDKDQVLTGFHIDENGEMVGMATVDRLVQEASSNNFALSVYRIDPEKIYYWSQIPEASRIYKDLSSEFSELGGLIKKMSSEKLTGYIDVTLSDGKQGGIIFFKNGVNLGGSYSWGDTELDSTKESLEKLVRSTKELGGTFHVNKIELDNANQAEIEPGPEKTEHIPAGPVPQMGDVIYMIEELLNILENIVLGQKKIRENFSTLLKKKFVEKADVYDFLDPFAAEFEYLNRKITFIGNASQEELATGVIECVNEMVDELAVTQVFEKESAQWREKHEEDLKFLGVNF